MIKDSNNIPRYEVKGKYTKTVNVTDLKTGETWEVFKSPEFLPDYEKMFNFNINSLQLNMLSDTLAKKLPPSDSRFRPDMINWEKA